MYKHPEINYTPNHPMLQFEPSGLGLCNVKNPFGGKGLRKCERDSAWAAIFKKYKEVGSQNTELWEQLKAFAEKFYYDKINKNYIGWDVEFKRKKGVGIGTWITWAYDQLRKNKEKGKAAAPCCMTIK